MFDETQKILPGVLEVRILFGYDEDEGIRCPGLGLILFFAWCRQVLLPAFGKRGHIDAPSVEGSNQAPRRVSTTDCVFIFIIDMAIGKSGWALIDSRDLLHVARS